MFSEVNVYRCLHAIKILKNQALAPMQAFATFSF